MKLFKRALASLLAVSMMCSAVIPSVGTAFAAEPAEAVQAAAAADAAISNPGFEEADLTAAPGGDAARDPQKWYQWNGVRASDSVRSGNYAVKFNANPDSSIEMDLLPLEAGKTYTFSVWAKGTVPATKPFIGAKNLAPNYPETRGEVKVEMDVNPDTWTQNKVTFNYASGNPRVYMWAPNNSANGVYLDDAALTEGYLPAPEASNLLIDPSFETKALSDSIHAQVGVWNKYNYTIADEAIGHGAKVAVAAPNKETTMTQAVKLEKGAKYEFSVWARKGANDQTNAAPVIGVKNHGGNEIKVPLKLNADGTWTRNSVVFEYTGDANAEVYVYTPAHSGNLNLKLDSANLLKIAEPAVVPPVEPEPEPEQPSREPAVFYVSNSGNDTNDGLSMDKPFQSIAHLNTLHFVPGDQILFKKGDVFTGAFKPQGSGTPEKPIVIKSYGDAAAKPVLEPGQAWPGKLMKAGGSPNGHGNTASKDVMYNGCIWLENVEGYEVRDLELRNPKYDPNNHRVNDFTEFTAGVRVMNNNAGDLHYFVFDNLTIHGFRGPGENFGKSAGGIQFNVLVDPQHLEEETGNKRSASHDIQITNCEIYNCGRSGVNFLNPWGRRQPKDGKWDNATEGVLPWYPYTNFYMANNVLHHIDGDALIVDNVSNAVVEKNLCYETAIHLSNSPQAAVGFFNWNSDDTCFQYNEVFNVGKNATRHVGSADPILALPGDAQGIEIDALNDRTWVQHNYVHDNYGGFMMWCNLSRVYPSYDGIIRYNISENDYVKEHGLFDSFAYQYGSETYNNAFIMNPDTALKDGVVHLFHNNQNLVEQHKMYNNIFYLTGDTPYPVNSFSDNNFDWRSNIFYNFTDLPVNDDPMHPNIAISKDQLAENPLFVKVGLAEGVQRFPTAFRGVEELRRVLKGYEIQENSPAVQAGVWLDSMSQQMPDGMTKKVPLTDFFGNPVPAVPDIGVHQSGFTAPPRVSSSQYPVDPIEKVITVPYGTTAEALLASLIIPEGAEKQLTKAGSAVLQSTDTLTVALDGKQQVYTIFVNTLLEIPARDHTVADGNHNSASEAGSNVLLDDNSLWHTNWGGTDIENMWLSLTLPADKYVVTGLTYLPRQDGNPNGTITQYRIEGRNASTEQWTTITAGTWAGNSSRKTAAFETEQNYTQYRLCALATVGKDAGENNKYASAQQVRLLGYPKAVAPVAPHTEATTFYVSASGSDANSGTTPAEAFQTIDHLNKIQFVPGDKILFKAGDVFTGTLKPQGSGTAKNPIVISSYGTGAKPVLEPGASWSGLIMKAGGNETYVEPVTYSGTILLENVQGYEIRGLELRDPRYNADDNRVNQFTEYSAGIRVVNDNQGDLYHFVFDNLSIHGFRGPGSNLGKSSGGIQFNVMVDPAHKNDANANTPSAMHDITITNNEIYNCGRSGINFLNPWGRRQPKDGKWAGVTEGYLPWHPFTNFYVANNVFHHIDGDAMIIDNVSNSVVEKNLCYETAIHLGYFGAAVGFFNWNSDDTCFQYNEVFNIGKDATAQSNHNEPVPLVPGDAQGIEIDALNDRTWVQHNYVHDNYGGFMMWCNPRNYPSYNGVVRYNISENDHAAVHGVFDSRPEQYGSETYNNIVVLNPETALKNGRVNLFGYGDSYDTHKMYNNIFYLTGDVAYPVNSFSDNNFDWRSNIFYNITGLPVIDDPEHPNISITKDSPLFVDAGLKTGTERYPTAYRGLDAMREALKGYQIQKDSPAVKAGIRLESMNQTMPDGMNKEIPLTDFFGNPVTGIPDIGVHQSDFVALRVSSGKYAVDTVHKTITVPYGTTAAQLLAGMTAPEGVTMQLNKTGAAVVQTGDTLTAALGDQTLVYTITADKLAEIPAGEHTAADGNHNSAEEAGSNVLLDDNSLWHTDWNGTDAANLWLSLTLPADKYVVTGLTYLPRQDSNPNGTITKYRIEGRNTAEEEWQPIVTDTWANDKTRKTVTFAAEQTYSQYRLVALETAGKTAEENNKFASAQQVRLLGYAKPVLPVSLYGASLSLAGNVGVNFLYEMDEAFLADDTACVEITLPENKTLTFKASEGVKDTTAVPGKTLYKFTAPVTVRQMSDALTVKVLQNGAEVVETVHFSVRDYADIILDPQNQYPENVKTFVRTMLYHGAAMQTYKDHNTDNLATKGVNVEDIDRAAQAVKAEELPAAALTGKAPAGLNLYGVSLSLVDETALRFYFTKDAGVKVEDFTFDTGLDEATITHNEDMICVAVENIAADHLDAIVTLKVGDLTIRYSPLSYARSVLEGNASENLKQVVRSLVVYNRAAEGLRK